MIIGDIPNGWLVIDKPSGVSSNFVNIKIKKHFEGKVKVGFAGTLDPLASGVLPVAVGKATRIISFVTEQTKQYSFTIVWGEQRSTDDAAGEVVSVSGFRPSKDEITDVLNFFRGIIVQVPPVFSAVKLCGRRACDRARKGETVIISPREVNILDIKLVNARVDSADFFVHCSKGTYVRSIARDLAKRLGTFGYASNIRRLCVEKFTLNKTITLEKLLTIVHTAELGDYMLPIDYALDDIPACQLGGLESVSFKHGRITNASDICDFKGIVRVYDEVKAMLGIGRICEDSLIPLKVFV